MRIFFQFAQELDKASNYSHEESMVILASQQLSKLLAQNPYLIEIIQEFPVPAMYS